MNAVTAKFKALKRRNLVPYLLRESSPTVSKLSQFRLFHPSINAAEGAFATKPSFAQFISNLMLLWFELCLSLL